jgi:hypothetical protein
MEFSQVLDWARVGTFGHLDAMLRLISLPHSVE